MGTLLNRCPECGGKNVYKMGEREGWIVWVAVMAFIFFAWIAWGLLGALLATILGIACSFVYGSQRRMRCRDCGVEWK